MKITKTELRKIIKEELGGLTRPKGGGYGSNSEALPHLLKSLESLKAARGTKSPLAQDVATFAYLSARDVQKELETLISTVKEDLPPGMKEGLLKEEKSVQVGLDFLDGMRELLRDGKYKELDKRLTMLMKDAD